MSGLGIGLYQDLREAARRLAPMERIYKPDRSKAAIYDKLRRVQERLYEAFSDSFKELEKVRRDLPAKG